MTKEEAIAKLIELSKDSDFETAHGKADDVLCDMLRSLGYADIVDQYDKVGKWYA